MSDNNKNNSVEDIIDLTEVVSIGSQAAVQILPKMTCLILL